MSLAAYLAQRLALPYPSRAAISTCRSKHAMKRTWGEEGLPCPEAQIVREVQDLLRFLRHLRRPVVLKPLTGSGSELVLMCRDPAEARAAYATISARLEKHQDGGLYGWAQQDPTRLDPRQIFLAEEFVAGTEYSCDFVLDDEGARIVRTARKIVAAEPPGTAVAYELPATLPQELDRSLRGLLAVAARSLGLHRALVMVDFIIRDNRILLLEMTPRIGGDCLPPLIRCSCGLDMIGLALDFAVGRAVDIPPRDRWERLAGVQLRSLRAGWIKRLSAAALLADPRVRECHLRRQVGHAIRLPPEDYDSWMLGHAIFAPTPGHELTEECAEIAALLELEVTSAPPVAAASAQAAPVALRNGRTPQEDPR
jgi:biotin carboxylase